MAGTDCSYTYLTMIFKHIKRLSVADNTTNYI